MEEKEDWGEDYERAMRVEGDAVYEVGIKDPSGNGYHTIRIPFNEDDFDREELRERVSEAKEHLEDDLERAEENRAAEETHGPVEELNEL